MAQMHNETAEIIKIDLGCGRYKREGFIGVDKFAIVNPDIVCDVENEQLPFKDSSVAEIYSSHVFEHIVDIQTVMNECFRVLAPNGTITIRVPYWSSEGAFRDPTHVRFFSEKTFEYWRQNSECAYYASAAPFEIEEVWYELHPSPVIKIVRRLFGIRFLKAFNNTITSVNYRLKPVK